MNAKSPFFGDSYQNTKGRQLETINRSGGMTYQGSPFHTFIGRRNLTTPNKVIISKKFNFNLRLQQGPQKTIKQLEQLFIYPFP